MMYCLVLPLTLIDLVPDVSVGVFPQPAEVARLVRTSGVLGVVSSDLSSVANLCQYVVLFGLIELHLTTVI